MRVGLLVCDHVSPEFIDVAGDYPAMFARLFAPYPDVELVEFDVVDGQVPESPDECDAWITTGSRRSVYDDEPWIVALVGFVRDLAAARRRYIGVCFGHQMIAHALGGKVERADTGWGVGVKEVVVADPPDWLGVDRYRVLNSHADQVTDLPPGAVVLGGNEHCPVSLMTVGDHFLGIQGHPEFTEAYAAALLLARRGKLIPAETVDVALLTLDDPVPADVLAGALVRFLTAGGG